jgi:hypothetical protein
MLKKIAERAARIAETDAACCYHADRIRGLPLV